MSTNTYLLQAGKIEAVIVRKPIKNLHLSVLPPLGKVRVTAPMTTSDDAIRTMLATRLPWIRKQQDKFKSQDRQTKREYVSGETHFFLGRPYRLEVVYEDISPRVELKGKNKLILYVRPGSSVEKKAEVIADWYRAELRETASKLIEKWTKIIGASPSSWGIRQMKTRWGTCNEVTGRTLLNLELAKKPYKSIEYVVVHELLHLIQRKHDKRFAEMLDRYLPTWRREKEKLNRFMLSHESWD